MRLFLTTLLGLMVAGLAYAHPLVNRDGDYCHIPLSNIDAGIEASVGPPDCSIQVFEVGGTADGYCYCQWDVPKGAAAALDNIEWTKIVQKPGKDKVKYVLKTKYRKLGVACKLTAGGGDEYLSTDWTGKVVYKEPAMTLEALLVCLDGQEQ